MVGEVEEDKIFANWRCINFKETFCNSDKIEAERGQKFRSSIHPAHFIALLISK